MRNDLVNIDTDVVRDTDGRYLALSNQLLASFE